MNSTYATQYQKSVIDFSQKCRFSSNLVTSSKIRNVVQPFSWQSPPLTFTPPCIQISIPSKFLSSSLLLATNLVAGPGGSTAPPGSTEPYTFLLSPTQFYISTKPFTILLNPASFYRDQRISTEPFTFLVMSPEYFYTALHISTEPTTLLLSRPHFYRLVQCRAVML